MKEKQNNITPRVNEILIADESKETAKKILEDPEAKKYHFEIVTTGTECLKKLSEASFDLVLLDLYLPEIHGIEILKTIKSKKTGVILLSAQAMIQNYHAALKEGADYFLEKPFNTHHLFDLIKRFFSKTLHPDPFSGQTSEKAAGEHCYLPKMHPPDSYIKFWGTRGSSAVSGPEYVHFGGNTCCLEIRHDNDLIIIDAGTGIRPLGESLASRKVKTIHLFIGHTHWDHITGFPFFAPIYNPHCHIHIYAPIGFEKTVKELFTDMLAYAFFPVRLDDIEAKLTFQSLIEGHPLQIGKLTINTHYAFHPGPTFCFKVKLGEKTFGYATDNEVLMGYHGNPNTLEKDHPSMLDLHSLRNFFKDCDFLIHEAQYTNQEYQKKVGWGHSSISNATAFIKHCKIKEWIVTHHDPSHTDEDLQKKTHLHRDILEDSQLHCHFQMAHDGLTIPLG